MKILKDFRKFCDKNNLKYFLLGGTLLGAKRHKGFIPWDDDIDVGMYRKDYNKFIELWASSSFDHLFLQNKISDKRVPFNYSKLRINNTLFLEKEYEKSEIHTGIFIDIFPLDNITNPYPVGVTINYCIYKILYLISLRKNNYLTKYSIVNFFTNTLKYLIPDSFIYYQSEKCFRRYENQMTPYITSFGSGYGFKRQIVKKEFYGNGTKLEFEGEKFNVPSEYNKILENLYGDYNQLPPKEKQRSNHKIIKLDFGKY